LFCDDKVAWLFLEPATCIFEKLRAFSFSLQEVDTCFLFRSVRLIF